MLSFKAIESSGGAAHYFEATDDYYGDENENTVDDEESLSASSEASSNAKTKTEKKEKGGEGADKDASAAPGEQADAGAAPAEKADGPSKEQPVARKPGTGAEPGAPNGPGAASGRDDDPHGTLKKKGPHKGIWQGKGAAALGLTGRITREDLTRTLEGKLPSGELVRKGKTHGSKDRKGIDFTFSAPKSVSIQALVNGDKRIVEAHDKAVRATIAEMEKFAMARRKEGGKSLRENTGNLVVATFRHELSRAQDPQLHTHSLVMNMTQRSDGQWRALSNEDLLRNTKMLGAFYRNNLATQLRDMGYQLRETRKGGWEMAHISDKAIDHFSSRSKEIEKLLKARGQDRDNATTMQKQILTLASRQRKKTDVDRAILRQYWHDTAREANVDLGTPEVSFREAITKKVVEFHDRVREQFTGKSKRQEAADEAVSFAVEHLAERQGIFSKTELLEIAYGRAATRTDTSAVDAALERAKHDGRLVAELPLYQTARSLNKSAHELANNPGAAAFKGHEEYEKLTRSSWIALTMQGRNLTQDQAEAAVNDAIRRGALVPAEERYTTQQARKSEVRILALERAGRGAVEPITTDGQLQATLAKASLNEGQQAAVQMILTSRDRFSGVQGLAGTGKSHMMSKAIDGITSATASTAQANGSRIIGLAPYASQNRALEELGVKSQTVAAFLTKKAQHSKIDSNTIVFLDEASVVPARDMEKLMGLIEQRGARLIMIGDRKQTQAVEAGKPFEQLQDAGMTMAYLTEIQRQRNETLKAAVVHAANDRIRDAVDTLSSRTLEIADAHERHKTLAARYASLSPEDRAATLVVAGTNDARRNINGLIRKQLGLANTGDNINVLESIDMTRAQLGSASSYSIGNVVVPEATTTSGLAKGTQYEVMAVDLKNNRVLVKDTLGAETWYDPSKNRVVGVYERQQIKLAIGEGVVVTRNDKALGFRRGDRHEIVDITDKSVRLRSKAGQVVELARSNDLHLRYAYVSTVHSAQGLTADRVLIEADTRSLTANKAVFYVSISRERHDLAIYTDDRSRLANAMGREPKKYAALELRDERNEAFFLKGKFDKMARKQLAAQVRKQPPATTTPQPSAAATAAQATNSASTNTPTTTTKKQQQQRQQSTR